MREVEITLPTDFDTFPCNGGILIPLDCREESYPAHCKKVAISQGDEGLVLVRVHVTRWRLTGDCIWARVPL